jgi:hypothetical protein
MTAENAEWTSVLTRLERLAGVEEGSLGISATHVGMLAMKNDGN